jgi:hypothetical protein
MSRSHLQAAGSAPRSGRGLRPRRFRRCGSAWRARGSAPRRRRGRPGRSHPATAGVLDVRGTDGLAPESLEMACLLDDSCRSSTARFARRGYRSASPPSCAWSSAERSAGLHLRHRAPVRHRHRLTGSLARTGLPAIGAITPTVRLPGHPRLLTALPRNSAVSFRPSPMPHSSATRTSAGTERVFSSVPDITAGILRSARDADTQPPVRRPDDRLIPRSLTHRSPLIRPTTQVERTMLVP